MVFKMHWICKLGIHKWKIIKIESNKGIETRIKTICYCCGKTKKW